MSYVFSVTFFFTAVHVHLALVAASISHFVTTATKLSCYSSNKKMSLIIRSHVIVVVETVFLVLA